MDDHGHIQVYGDLQLFLKGGPLPVAIGVIIVVVQPYLADSDNALVLCVLADQRGHRVAETVGLVWVYALCAPDARADPRQLHDPLQVARGNGNRDDALYAHRRRLLQGRLQGLLVQVVQVAVSFDDRGLEARDIPTFGLAHVVLSTAVMIECARPARRARGR